MVLGMTMFMPIPYPMPVLLGMQPIPWNKVQLGQSDGSLNAANRWPAVPIHV